MPFPRGRVEFTDGASAVGIVLPGHSQSLTLPLGRTLGTGSFGVVHLSEYRGLPIALKLCRGTRHDRLEKEADCLALMPPHPNVVPCLFAAVSSPDAEPIAVFGLELCSPRTLHDFLLQHSLPRTADALFLLRQVVDAVGVVHGAGCVHRDLKLQNFVFGEAGGLRLIDFGLAATTQAPAPGDVVAGTLSFMAPEMAQNALARKQGRPCEAVVGAPADVWGIGVIAFSLLTRASPYAKHATTELLDAVAAGDWAWPASFNVDVRLKSFVGKLLTRDPSDRPSIAKIQACHHVWGRGSARPPPVVHEFLCPAVASVGTVVSEESATRRAVATVWRLGFDELQARLQLLLDLDEDRVNIVYMAQEGLRYLKHPHRFAAKLSWPARGYDDGANCDGCAAVIERDGCSGRATLRTARRRAPGAPLYYHCSCGMDLCGACFDERSRRASERVATKRRRAPTAADDLPALQRPEPRPLALQWNPFAPPAQDVEASTLPTAEERAQLTDAMWLRHFRVVQKTELLPECFAYSLQPGRTGAIFTDVGRACPKDAVPVPLVSVHSAVLSPLERRMFLVRVVDPEHGQDVVDTVELDRAPLGDYVRSAQAVLQRIAMEDANLIKVRRAPGTLSVLQSPPVVATIDEPVVYVRFMRRSTVFTVAHLSNGRCQCFAGTYELRWMDPGRKFLVRGRDMIQMIDDTFVHADALAAVFSE